MTREKLLEFAAWVEANNVKLLGRRIAVVPEEADLMTAGGLVIPEQYATKPKRGRVVAFGEGAKLPDKDGNPSEVLGLSLGDNVLHNVYNTLSMTIPDRDGQPVVVSVFHVTDIYLYWPKGVSIEVK